VLTAVSPTNPPTWSLLPGARAASVRRERAPAQSRDVCRRGVRSGGAMPAGSDQPLRPHLAQATVC
jgi:hypothetical protein